MVDMGVLARLGSSALGVVANGRLDALVGFHGI